MLFDFGLKRFPPLATILELASKTEDPVKQRKAFGYFLENFDTRYSSSYDPNQVAHLAFIPSLRQDGTAFLARPGEVSPIVESQNISYLMPYCQVFTNPECGFLGFALVEPSLRDAATNKLGVPRDPPATLLMSILVDRPPNEPSAARQMFEYLTTRIGDFAPHHFQNLRVMKIVPAHPPTARSATKEKQAADKWVLCKPGECFFRSDTGRSSDVHSKLFTFVDFGGKANMFLKACGVKDEPNVHEIAEMMVRDPKHFLELAGGPQGYLGELRQVAAQYNFDQKLLAQMRMTPFLLGSRRTPKAINNPKTPQLVDVGDAEEEDYEVVFDLLRPNQVRTLVHSMLIA